MSDTTFIEVTYILKNNGNTQSVQYGFPIDVFQKERYGEKNNNYYMEALYFEAFLNQEKKKTKMELQALCRGFSYFFAKE